METSVGTSAERSCSEKLSTPKGTSRKKYKYAMNCPRKCLSPGQLSKKFSQALSQNVHLQFQTQIVLSQQKSRAGNPGGGQTGGFPDLELSVPICPFQFQFFGDFPNCLGICPMLRGFSICLSRLSQQRTYKEHSRKGPEQSGSFPQKMGSPPRFGNSPDLPCLKKKRQA